jgi:hypothetical protein
VKKLALIVLLCSVVAVAAQTVSYWCLGFQRQPSAAAARQYLFAATNSPAPGDTIRWDGTNLYWTP